jgi:probable rRNA maturation factor
MRVPTMGKAARPRAVSASRSAAAAAADADRAAAAERADGGEGISVTVVDRQRGVRVGAAWLEGVVRRALARQGIGRATICVLLVDDRRMATLHRQWLGLPGPTDVITFDLGGGLPDAIEGDIAVSVETARRVAREVGWSARHEAAYYVVHGLLHLAGYDDHEPTDRRAMRARERVLLRAAGLPSPPPQRLTRR